MGLLSSDAAPMRLYRRGVFGLLRPAGFGLTARWTDGLVRFLELLSSRRSKNAQVQYVIRISRRKSAEWC